MSEYQILELRRLADKSEGRREIRFDTMTGDPKLVNPQTPGEDHEPWPTLGITIINAGGPPQRTTISTDYANQLVADGLLERKGEKAVTRPAGPYAAPWSVPPHTFIHADFLVFNDLERGKVNYRVTRQPDKYVAEGYEEAVEDYRSLREEDLPNTVVQHFYSLELVNLNSPKKNVVREEGSRG